MSLIEVFEGENHEPLLVAEYDFLPRVGEYLSQEMGGYFRYFRVEEIWHRQMSEGGAFRSCLRVSFHD